MVVKNGQLFFFVVVLLSYLEIPKEVDLKDFAIGLLKSIGKTEKSIN